MTWDKWEFVKEGPPVVPRIRRLDDVHLLDGWEEYTIEVPDDWEMVLTHWSEADGCEPLLFVRIRSPACRKELSTRTRAREDPNDGMGGGTD